MFFALVLSLGFHLPKQKTHGRSSAANLTTLVHEPAVDDISHPNTSKLTPKSKVQDSLPLSIGLSFDKGSVCTLSNCVVFSK
ncbi:hypothetical protein V6N13_074216 [Hibiscus sabdariffa]|uniref:Uncharacterized protein n=1 Tax=Hibiscus sabdariffa TaxID=183260 RepID=A0ABR2U7V3_9ROSI